MNLLNYLKIDPEDKYFKKCLFEKNLKIPEYFIDPITLEILSDPVITEYGNSYNH